jgi:type IV secretory pathway VirB3-like protein
MGIRNYESPTYRSLMKRELVGGVSQTVFIVLMLSTFFFVFYLTWYWFLAVIAALFIIARLLTKKDEFLLDIILSSLTQPDDLEP